MRSLDHSPPRLSDLPPRGLAEALARRHDAERERWLRIHDAAALSTRQRLAALARNLFTRRKP